MKKAFPMLFLLILCILTAGCGSKATETQNPVVQEPGSTDKVSSAPTVTPTVKPTKTPTPQKTPVPTKKASSEYETDDDPYDAKDYAHPDDFYYDHYDDFWEYEEAEEYWEDNQ